MHKRLLLGCVVALSMVAAAQASGPVPVSPGDGASFLGVGSTCPTFSWTAGTDAGGYELVVYSMLESDGGVEMAAPDLEGAPVIRATVPPGALSWTPPS